MKAKKRNTEPPERGDMGIWKWPAGEGTEIVRCEAVNGSFATVERIEYCPDEYNDSCMVIRWDRVDWNEK